MSASGKNRGLSVELLKLYAQGLVSPAQAAEIERLLADDEEARLILEGIRAGEAAPELEQEVSQAAKRFDEAFTSSAPGKGSVRYLRPALYVAAAVVLAFLIFTPFGKSTDSLVNDYLSEPYAYQVYATAGNDEILGSAVSAYQAEEFAIAYSLFDSLSAPKESEVAFYQALSALYSGQYETASKEFMVLSKQASILKSHSLWFYALAEFKLGKPENCKAAIQEINQGDYAFEEAQKLLKQL